MHRHSYWHGIQNRTELDRHRSNQEPAGPVRSGQKFGLGSNWYRTGWTDFRPTKTVEPAGWPVHRFQPLKKNYLWASAINVVAGRRRRRRRNRHWEEEEDEKKSSEATGLHRRRSIRMLPRFGTLAGEKTQENEKKKSKRESMRENQ